MPPQAVYNRARARARSCWRRRWRLTNARARARVLCGGVCARARAQLLAEAVVINSSFKSDVELDDFGKARPRPITII